MISPDGDAQYTGEPTTKPSAIFTFSATLLIISVSGTA